MTLLVKTVSSRYAALEAAIKAAHSYEVPEIIAVPIMVVMMILASRADVMGHFVIRPRLRRLGWLATGVMAVTVAAMLGTS